MAAQQGTLRGHRPEYRIWRGGRSDERLSQAHTRLLSIYPGHYIAVNNEAKLVMIASANFEAKIYSRVLGYQGIRLSFAVSFGSTPLTNSPSICLQLVPGQGNTSLFYSLRKELKEGEKITKVYRVRKGQEEFEEEGSVIEDTTAHLMVPRGGEGSYFVLGEKWLYFTNKGKLQQIKIPQSRASQQVSWWRRPLR